MGLTRPIVFNREIFKYFNRKEIESSKTINWKRRAWKHVNTVRVNCGPLALADNVISDKIPFYFFFRDIFKYLYRDGSLAGKAHGEIHEVEGSSPSHFI